MLSCVEGYLESPWSPRPLDRDEAELGHTLTMMDEVEVGGHLIIPSDGQEQHRVQVHSSDIAFIKAVVSGDGRWLPCFPLLQTSGISG